MLTIHAYIEVPILEDGLRFYCEGLGLTLKRRFSRTWVELGGANTPIFLLGNRGPVADLGTTSAVRRWERHWTPVHLDFIVDDLDDVVERLVTFGATLDRPTKAQDYGRIANMADPFGNGFDLIEFDAVGYDAVNRAEGN
jgi:predicted enzyme related to lactoylglutathione lyase